MVWAKTIARFLDWRVGRRGNIGVISALAVLPFAITVSLGMEFVEAQSKTEQLQNALDGSLLAATKTSFKKDSERNAFVRTTMRAMLQDTDLVNSAEVSVQQTEGGGLSAEATARDPLFFPVLWKEDAWTLNAKSSTTRQAMALDAMLVLDVTGSMAGSKIATLRQAASDFVGTVMKGEKVKVGITPFSQYVNIGASNRNWPGFSIPADTKQCSLQTVNTTKTTCTGSIMTTCYNDGVPYACKQNTGCTTVVTGTTKANQCTGSVWTGCIGSREYPANVDDKDTVTPVPGVFATCNSSTLVRMTDNKSALISAIKGLNASGQTYLPAGLMTGWTALSPRAPLPDGTPFNPTSPTKRVLVLMTDGENTVSKYKGQSTHNGTDRNAADTLTKELCANIKKDDITLVAVAFEIDDLAAKSMLKDSCASSGWFYDAKNEQDLLKAFEEIVGRLSALRISQ